MTQPSHDRSALGVDVADALGNQRASQVTEAVQRLLRRADDAPAFTESLTHILFAVKAHDADAISREIDERVKPDPDEEWNYLTFVTPDGKRYARANAFMHRSAAMDGHEWAVAFTLSEQFMRLGSWWFTQLWRAAELAAGAWDSLDNWSVLVAAACARSLLEGAAYMNDEVSSLVELWDGVKRQGMPTTEQLGLLVEQLNRRVTSLQYSTRIGRVLEQHPNVSSKNVLAYMKKAARQSSTFDAMDTYEWLCDAVHPSYGSATAYRALGLGDNGRTHVLDRYERRPLDILVATPQGMRLQPTIAQKAAEAATFASDLLYQDLGRARWVVEDIGLTVDVKSSIRLQATLAHTRPERNQACPCGSGRKFKKCVHRWGESGVPIVAANVTEAP